MNKSLSMDLINALKTLKDIFLRYIEMISNTQKVSEEMSGRNVTYQQNVFKKVFKDINFLMEKTLKQEELMLYRANTQKKLEELLEPDLTPKVKKAYEEFQLMLQGLRDKLMDFEYILENLESRLEE